VSLTRSSTGPQAAPDDEAPSPLFIERIAERYEIERVAGRGGMATVWLARRRRDGKRVALKVLRSGLSQALGSRRFLREIGIATQVQSPALMPLEESGEIDGVLYYVMPFAEGGSLRQRMDRERQLPVHEAVRIARAVASGLAALHRNGFVHRDVKPENVLLNEHGDALLADYGIARAVFAAATDVHTSTGIVLGTPAYMSPEQGGGEAVDGRSDVYALGCVLYEMLAGSPPFQGPSAQAVIARHMGQAPPPLRVVRPAVNHALESVVLQALAKVPADRFDCADAFTTALESVITPGSTPAVSPTPPRWKRVHVGTGILVALAVAVTSAWYVSRTPALVAERVVVFPLTDRGPAHAGEGERLAMLMGSALERTDATQWLDGLSLLDQADHPRAQGLSTDRARAIARGARARYFLDGTVHHGRDSVSVQVRLFDVEDGSLLKRGSAAAPATASTGDLALKAVVQVMPALSGLSRVVDVSSLTGRSPSAVNSWLRGEREFRSMRMHSALHFLQQAVAEDSLLSPAAFRAATAASWINRTDTALALVRLALRHPEGLPQRQRPFARSLERFLSGRADEAMIALRPALSRREETAEAWMLAGEIQLHLLPTIGVDSNARRAVPPPTEWPYEAFAREAFLRAREIDPEFTPPLAHLAEIAARRGDVDGVKRLTAMVVATNPDTMFAARMRITERCLRGGMKAVDWAAESRRNARTVFNVGAELRAAMEPRARRCGLAAFASIVASQEPQGPEYWSSLLALHAMLVAQGEVASAVGLVDSAVARGLTNALGLYVIDATVGIDVGGRAAGFIGQLEASIGDRGPASLWLLTLNAARAGDVAQLTRIRTLLEARSRSSTAQRLDSLMTQVTSAYLAVAQHDTTLALRRFDALVPTATQSDVEGSLWESLAPERLQHARLLLARGRAADAHRVASTFDQPRVLINQLFLRASLQVRIDAAKALNDRRLERRALDGLALLASVAVP
jgi:serine/threonine-protein kinase